MTFEVNGSRSWEKNTKRSWNHGSGVACLFPFPANNGVSSSTWPLIMLAGKKGTRDMVKRIGLSRPFYVIAWRTSVMGSDGRVASGEYTWDSGWWSFWHVLDWVPVKATCEKRVWFACVCPSSALHTYIPTSKMICSQVLQRMCSVGYTRISPFVPTFYLAIQLGTLLQWDIHLRR